MPKAQKHIFQMQVNSHEIVDFEATSSIYNEAIIEALKSGIFNVFDNNQIKIWAKSFVPESVVSKEQLRDWADRKMAANMYEYGPYFYFAFMKDGKNLVWNGSKENFYQVADSQKPYVIPEKTFFGLFEKDIKDTSFAKFKSKDWILFFLNNVNKLSFRDKSESLVSIISRVATGTEVSLLEAVWSDGSSEYVFSLKEDSSEFDALGDRVKIALYDGNL